jgi:hypothetical protein
MASLPLDESLTFPLPAAIVFSFKGVPEEDYAQLKEWCGHRATLARCSSRSMSSRADSLTRRRLVEGQQLEFHPNISFRGPLALWVRA